VTRIGRDSTVITDIPVTGTEVIMPYANGLYAVSGSAVTARFHTTPIAWFDVLGNDLNADILDWESGDAGFPSVTTPVNWTKGKLALKQPYLPIIYVSRANLTTLFNGMNAAGLSINKHFKLGITTLDGTRTVADMTGVTFVQDKGQSLTGGHYDESIIYDDNWKKAVIVTPPPVITRIEALAYINANLK
jgi:hypothetical protein